MPEYEIVEKVAWDYIKLSSDEGGQICSQGYDCLYFGTLALRGEKNRHTLFSLLANHTFKHVFFDVNLRKNYYSEALLRKLFTACTIFKLNDDEVEVLSVLFYHHKMTPDAFAMAISDEFMIKTVLITLGSDGACCFHNGEFVQVQGVKVKVADTVGAGDSFTAAFLNSFLDGEDVKASLQSGCKLGAFVASRYGAIPECKIEP